MGTYLKKLSAFSHQLSANHSQIQNPKSKIQNHQILAISFQQNHYGSALRRKDLESKV
jgi:hypothetical protein